MTSAEWAVHYIELGFALTPLEPLTKAPRGEGWNRIENCLTDSEKAERYWSKHSDFGMGLVHQHSRTAALDVDQAEYAETALAAVGINLEAVRAAANFQIQGKNGAKPVYVLGETLGRKNLAWPDPSGALLPNGKPKLINLFELRGGAVQDVLPPSIHPDTHKPYLWLPTAPAHRDDITPLPQELLELWQHWPEAKAVMLAACPWAEVEEIPTPTPRPVRNWSGQPGESLIAQFNRRYTVQEVLERNGYRRVGSRFASPSSSTGIPGVVILRGQDGLERAYSHHGSDALTGEHSHDAFSAYSVLEHQGDVRAAVKAAAPLFGERVEAKVVQGGWGGANNDAEGPAERLSRKLGVEITRFVKWLIEPARYSLFVGEREVELGEIDGISNQTQFRNRIMDVAGLVPTRIAREDWDGVLRDLMSIRESQPVMEQSQLERLQKWVSEYLERYKPTAEEEGPKVWDGALKLNYPVSDDEGVWISANHLRLFILNSLREDVSSTQLAKQLKSFGAEGKKMQFREGKPVTRRYWLVPDGVLSPEETENQVEEVTL